MSYVSLYRKWRSQSFSQLVGQDHIARTLANAIKGDRVAHAYLFAGPRGTGKTSTAKILAKAVNCESGPTPEPCGKCDSCLTITAGTSLDVIEMDAASNRGIDEIRELRDKVAFAATAGRRKVYIIDEVHMLTEPAFNALLKTLEEPPAHVIFILATTDPNKVPTTISSRCQHFEFRRIPLKAITGHLANISKAEKMSVAPGVLNVIAGQAEGSMRDAIGMLDQLAAYTDKTVTEEDAVKFLGLIDTSLVEKCIDLLSAGEVQALFEFTHSLAETGRDWRQFTAAALSYLRDLFVLIHVADPQRRRQLLNVGDESLAVREVKARQLGADRIRSWLTEFRRLYESLRTAAEPRLSLELTLVDLARGQESTLESLVERIRKLETGIIEIADTSDPVEESQDVPRPQMKIDLDRVKKEWPRILAKVKRKRLSLYAFLIEGRPVEIENGCLKIAFGPKGVFAGAETAKEPNKTLLKEVLTGVLGTALDFDTIPEDSIAEEAPRRKTPGNPTEYPGGRSTIKNAADGAFGCASSDDTQDVSAEKTDVLDMVKKSFGAQVVDESDLSTLKKEEH